KRKLKASGFGALHGDPEEWWRNCPPHVKITICIEEKVVRYCFDPNESHEDDYYEYGDSAVITALQEYFLKPKCKVHVEE
ncbi:MAG: hypothetical protein N3F10_07870, partial [Candidatus Bathyarchaeota archaeon]|nr:hypothetical protein [Candidatus Bathyarchaeota archaeon]